jgi:hypothetical protein
VEKEHAGPFRLNMLAGKGYSWKAAKARLPPSRQVIHAVRNPKFLVSVGLIAAIVLLWRSMGSAAQEVQRYVTLLVSTEWQQRRRDPSYPTIANPSPSDSTASALQNLQCT